MLFYTLPGFLCFLTSSLFSIPNCSAAKSNLLPCRVIKQPHALAACLYLTAKNAKTFSCTNAFPRWYLVMQIQRFVTVVSWFIWLLAVISANRQQRIVDSWPAVAGVFRTADCRGTCNTVWQLCAHDLTSINCEQYPQDSTQILFHINVARLRYTHTRRQEGKRTGVPFQWIDILCPM